MRPPQASVRLFLSAPLLLCALTLPLGAGETAARLTPIQIEAYWVTPDQPAKVTLSAENLAAGAKLDYQILDYREKEIARGQTEVGADNVVAVEVKLPQGYYELRFPALNQACGLAALPAYAGAPDQFWAIDAAMSWVGAGNRDLPRRGEMIRVLKRCGVTLTRERVSWSAVNREKGQWEWDKAKSFYASLRKLYADCQMPVLEVFHDAPTWTGAQHRNRENPQSTDNQYPENLNAEVESWREIARQWGATWESLEVWNEPDIGFSGDLPGDHYSPLVKTMAYLFDQEKIPARLVGGVFANSGNWQYFDTCAENGLLEKSDVISFHTYSHAEAMFREVQKHRDYLRRFGRESTPLWITECGRPWKKGPGRPPLAEDAESALDIAMKGVEARACGIERYFPFIFVYYEEKINNFGMMGKEDTPLRSMAAYAQLIRVLAGTEYVGDLAFGEELKRVRVFRQGEEAVVVYYNAQPVGEAKLTPAAPVRRAAGLDGRALAPDAEGKISLADGLTYVWYQWSDLAGQVKSDTEAMPLYRAGHGQPPARQPAESIVLQPRILKTDATPAITKSGYLLNADQSTPIRLAIRAHNLGEAEETVKLTANLPAGMTVADGQAEKSLTLAPHSSADVEWPLSLAQTGAYFWSPQVLKISAQTAAGASLPPLVQHFSVASEKLDRWLEVVREKTRVPLELLANWEENIAGDSSMKLEADAAKSWKLTAKFAPNIDAWVYPKFKLPEEIKFKPGWRLLIRARETGKATPRLMLDEQDGSTYWASEGFVPPDGEWHVRVLGPDNFSLLSGFTQDENNQLDLDQIHRIQLGLNSGTTDNTLEVSDFYIVYP